MKWFALALFLIPVGAFAASVDATPASKIESACREQAGILRQTLVYYQTGASEERAYDEQVSAEYSEESKKWLSYLIDQVYWEQNSRSANPVREEAVYLSRCLEAPESYVREQSLME